MHSLHHLVEMSPSEAVIPGKTQRPGHVPTNNEMVKHNNKWWKIKTIKTREQLSESEQDYGRRSAWIPGDEWILLSFFYSGEAMPINFGQLQIRLEFRHNYMKLYIED